MIRSTLAFATSLLFLSCGTARLQASSISGALTGTSTLTATNSAGVYTQNFSGDGEDQTYGSFTPTGTATIDFSNPPNIIVSDGTFLETFSQGTLFGTDAGTGTASGQGSATLSLIYMITGGTGIFAGATGEAVASIVVTAAGVTTESESGTYAGNLSSTPEPGSLVLLTSATVLAFCLRRRRAVRV